MCVECEKLKAYGEARDQAVLDAQARYAAERARRTDYMHEAAGMLAHAIGKAGGVDKLTVDQALTAAGILAQLATAREVDAVGECIGGIG